MSTLDTDPSVDDEDELVPGLRRSGASRSARAQGQRWIRWIHVYTSMISLLLVLFFGLTGLTLNHPDWTFGDKTTTTTQTGRMTFAVAPKGTVDFLSVSEFLRNKYGISAEVSDHGATSGQGSISYRGPGYAADVTFATDTGKYSLTVEQQGFVGVMNDLHKGRDTSSSWKWVIDVVAIFLVVIALSGLGLQLFLRRRRRSALVVVGVGVVLAVAFIWSTV